MVSFFAISGTGTPLSFRARAKRRESSSMAFGRAAVVALGCGGD
jgi:hypothetical protein